MSLRHFLNDRFPELGEAGIEEILDQYEDYEDDNDEDFEIDVFLNDDLN